MNRTHRASLLSLCLWLVAPPSAAWAQACCAGANALTPGRLALHEDALIGLQMRGGYVLGSWSPSGQYLASPARAVELDLDQALLGAVRLTERLQAGVVMPVVQTYRSNDLGSELGAGFGDLQIGGRYDFVLAGESRRVPGIALLASATLPTGVPPEQAKKALATDATGVGCVRLGGGLALEQQFGHVLVNLTGSASWASPRTTTGINAQDGLSFGAFAALGWVWNNTGALALTGSFAAELPGTVDGKTVNGDGRASTRVGLAGGSPVTDHLRLSGSLFLDLPASALGRGQPAQAGLTFILIRSWS